RQAGLGLLVLGGHGRAYAHRHHAGPREVRGQGRPHPPLRCDVPPGLPGGGLSLRRGRGRSRQRRLAGAGGHEGGDGRGRGAPPAGRTPGPWRISFAPAAGPSPLTLKQPQFSMSMPWARAQETPARNITSISPAVRAASRRQTPTISSRPVVTSTQGRTTENAL